MPQTEHHRRSIRLKGHDYSAPGAYFVTICTQNRECLFWDDPNDKIVLSHMGQIAKRAWLDLPRHYSNVRLDVYCIMPDHVHGIIELTDGGTDKRHGLPEIIRAFKSFSARRINVARHTMGVPVWQRNYYEHIIRHQVDWARIRGYIAANPQNWVTDEGHRSNLP